MRIELLGYEDLLVSRLVNADGSPMRDPSGRPIVNKDGTPVENWGRWYFKEFAGKASIVGTDNPEGVIIMRVRGAELAGEMMQLWRPSVQEVPAQQQPEGRLLPKSTYRLCYRRAHYDWRVRDEEMDWFDPDSLHFVAGYVGDLVGSWFNDPLAHIFHTKELVLVDGSTPCLTAQHVPCSGHGLAVLLDPSLS